MKNWLKKLFCRPRLSDLPPDERRRAKAMMLGAGAGSTMKAENGVIRVETLNEKKCDSVV